MTGGARISLSSRLFVERLQREGLARYHHQHPFHVRMHEGALTKQQLQQWVLNRYYYQTRIPIKDALILSKSEDPEFRRAWIHRLQDHDGDGTTEGGLALWRRLAAGVGLDEDRLTSFRAVLPGVRFACDGYISFVREATLVEAVASSLTELFAPDLMTTRIAAWERHYPWVDRSALDYFRSRVPRASRDAGEALQFVLDHATTVERQDGCVAALGRKTDILWHLLDCLDAASVRRGDHAHDDHAEPSQVGR
jgi:pyrroloquinoline-quinone synthase